MLSIVECLTPSIILQYHLLGHTTKDDTIVPSTCITSSGIYKKKRETNDRQHSHNFVSLSEPLLVRLTSACPGGTLYK